MNTVDPQPLYGWNTLDWKKIERRVFKLQTRISRAQRRGDSKTVRKLQRFLMKSRSAKLLAVRRLARKEDPWKRIGRYAHSLAEAQQRLSVLVREQEGP